MRILLLLQSRLGTKVQLNQVIYAIPYVTHVTGDEKEPNNRPTIIPIFVIITWQIKLLFSFFFHFEGWRILFFYLDY